jgi:hypothetical protein
MPDDDSIPYIVKTFWFPFSEDDEKEEHIDDE